MNQEVKLKNKKILIAPLDWGLGHAARCIPIIKALLAARCTVVLAADGKTATLLQTEFPHLQLLPLTGYRISYTKNKSALAPKILAQIPKIKRAIKEEHLWLQMVVEKHQIDAVISDNRYGLHHPTIPCILITHQLLIKTGFGAFADSLLQKMAYQYIDQFSECWVPDEEENIGLAGRLSHPKILPQIPVSYIGPLSRFSIPTETVLTHFLLIILSGPEPQRSILESILLEQVKDYKEPVLFVRGLPDSVALPTVPYHVTIVNHLATSTLQLAMENASFVVSRCGYSTVMDITRLQKKAIMIPTPGQTEQEYLATYLTEKNRALCIPQSKFKLKAAIELAQSFPYQLMPAVEDDGLEKAIDSLLKRL